MEKIELFLFDIFGNFIPGSIITFLCFDSMIKILRLNLLDVDIRKKIMIWVFIFTSYIIGNSLNMFSSWIFKSKIFSAKGIPNNKLKFFHVKNVIDDELKIDYLKNKFSPNEITYDRVKTYIESKSISNFISKYEAKYIFYRNLTLALLISFTISFIEKIIIIIIFKGPQDIVFSYVFIPIIIISILITFYNFKYYWDKSGKEVMNCIYVIQVIEKES